MNTETITKKLFEFVVANCNLVGGEVFDNVSCIEKLDDKSFAIDFGGGDDFKSYIVRVEKIR